VALQKELLAIPAVIESGLFLNMTDTVIVGHAEGVRLLSRLPASARHTSTTWEL
jgi:ribose 5-phosphate isomerase